MAGDQIRGLTPEIVVEAYERTGSILGAAKHLGVNRSTIRHHLRKVDGGKHLIKPLVGGREKAEAAKRHNLPPKGKVKRWLLTSAQNNTKIHEPTWQALTALAKHYKADLLVGTFTYNQNAYGQLSVKRGTTKAKQTELWYDERLMPFIDDGNHELAPGLVWCGRMNTLPTAADPLSGFETYTGRKSGIFPHAKHAMRSIASSAEEPAKFNYTTGTVTQLNYIQKRAGLKAEHHHTYGALLVEVDSNGTWFVRQLQCDKQGRMYDLDVAYEDGKVVKRRTLEAITWGDIHAERVDPIVRQLAWAKGGIVDTLKPKHQFVHDLIDFGPRNHHNIKDPHFRFQRFIDGEDTVEGEMEIAVQLLKEMDRAYCKTVVVNSNHDNALKRWLREGDYRTDPANALFFLQCQLRQYQAMANQEEGFMILEWVLRSGGCPEDVHFLRADESFVTCRDRNGGIENGNHGDVGPNGARGTPRNLAKQGRRQNTGHTHSAGILDGMFSAGCSCELRMGYNKGPSSWSHSFIATYPNGKRTIVTVYNGKYRA